MRLSKTKVLSVFVIGLFIGAGVVPNVTSGNSNLNKILYVDDEGDGDYTSIQDAIDAAYSGDTIEVYSGRYKEEVAIDKALSLIGIDEELGIGDDSGKPVIDGDFLHSVVGIFSDDVSIEGFDIINSNSSQDVDYINYGIIVYNVTNVQIEDCVIDNNFWGIWVSKVKESLITDCIISNNRGHGLCLTGFYSSGTNSVNNKISGCTFTNNGYEFGWAICMAVSTSNEFVNCNVIGNDGGFGVVRFNNAIFNNGVFQKNTIHQCNFIDNGDNINAVDTCFGNNWDNNYYEDWLGLSYDFLSQFPYHISRFNFDMNPAKEPFDI